jgi:hypothetical protein
VCFVKILLTEAENRPEMSLGCSVPYYGKRITRLAKNIYE